MDKNNENMVVLANGESLEIKVNFLTLYYLDSYGLKRLENEMNNDKEIKAVARMIYAILKSNKNRNMTFEDALELVPIGEEDTFIRLFEIFSEEMKKFQKKTQAKQTFANNIKA